MSDSQVYEKVTVTSDGVAVIKRFEEDEFPVPAIAFDFESDRDESVTVTMSDTVPDGIEVEDLGFHPEYGSEFWTIDDETITFERELEAGGSYTTVYGIRATGSDDVEQFLTEPTLESVDPPLPEDESTSVGDIIPETEDNVVKDAITGDGEIPGLEDGDDENDEVATLELNDPNDAETGESDASGGDGTDAVSVEDGSLTAALATEIRQQNISGEDLKLLRRALDVAAENDSSDRARIDQIQNDVADLRAYTSALEEFLDENGTGEELIEDFEQELQSFDDRLATIQSDIESNSTELNAVSETVSTVDEEMDSLGDDLADVRGDIGSVEAEVTDVSGELEELDGSIDEIESSIEELEEQVAGGEVLERVEEIEEQVNDLQAWQEQIKATFGGG